MNGTLYGVGIGPGDPELITLKAVRIIEQSPVLQYQNGRIPPRGSEHCGTNHTAYP